MVTTAQVIEIEKYCEENNISRVRRFTTLEINIAQFYRSKRKMLQEMKLQNGGELLQLSSGGEFICKLPLF